MQVIYHLSQHPTLSCSYLKKEYFYRIINLCCHRFIYYDYLYPRRIDNTYFFRLNPMQNIIKTLLLLLLWQLYGIYPSLMTAAAEEIDNLNLPLQDEERLFPVTFQLGADNASSGDISAILTLTEKATAQKTNYLLNSSQTVNLPAGEYTAEIRAGMRRNGSKQEFTVPLQNKKPLTFMIKPFTNIEPTGWIMLDAFYNPPSAISKSSLLSLGKALELRAIFTPLNNILSNSANFTQLHKKNTSLLAPVTGYLHPEYGELLAFNSEKPQASPFNPVILDKPLFPLLSRLHDSNSLTAISPIVYTRQKKSLVKKYSEEFIFDTIAGPLYDLFILNDFSTSLKIWHTLLNQGYRIPAIYTGGITCIRNPLIQTPRFMRKSPERNTP